MPIKALLPFTHAEWRTGHPRPGNPRITTPGSLRSLGSLFTSGRRAGRCGRPGQDSAYRQEKRRLSCDGEGVQDGAKPRLGLPCPHRIALPSSWHKRPITGCRQPVWYLLVLGGNDESRAGLGWAGSLGWGRRWAGSQVSHRQLSSCFGRFHFRQVPSKKGPAHSAPVET